MLALSVYLGSLLTTHLASVLAIRYLLAKGYSKVVSVTGHVFDISQRKVTSRLATKVVDIRNRLSFLSFVNTMSMG